MNDKELIKSIDLEDDNSILDVLSKVQEGELYTAKNENNEDIVIAIQPNVGLRISTYQSNGWIRINNYDIAEDENRQYYIIRSEEYEK